MGWSKDSIETPFLTPDDGLDNEPVAENQTRRPRPEPSRTHKILFAAQTIFGVLNLVFLIWNIAYRSSGCVHADDYIRPQEMLSPAESAIRYTVEIHSTSDPSPFTGPPRPEVDQAWSHLLRSTMVKLSEDEMRMMNKTSIALRDGTGYIGYLESLHMLHCVKRIYQSRHAEYYAGLQNSNAFTTGHLDHCLEVLRQGIMCNADVAINTFFWDAQGEIEANRTGPRKCTNWDRISEWADERRLTLQSREQFRPTLVPSDEPGSIGPA
ncbi:hypothetical protein GGS26DRAFT_544846 [Hypomontagnella submonticulosa]|nr:hypothetical protein GGS26DRAFT_544846 [Hypomontagnella submonticulosa]